MNRAFLSLLCGLALAFTSLAQTPSDDNEGLRITKDGPDAYTVSWFGHLGRYYFLQYSKDMVTWTHFPDAYGDGADLIFYYGITVSGPDRFFVRVKYLESYTGNPLNQDFDGDKVNTLDELEVGTDPFHTADMDGDGMPDDWEIHFGLDPLDPADATTGPAADPDGDGIPNRAEYEAGLLGTDPTDYYNGANYPTIQAIGWPVPVPTDEPGTLLPQPFVVEVRDGAVPVNNARVTFFTQGADAGQISLTNDGASPATILHRLTGSNGRAQVYFKHPSANPPEPTARIISAKVGSAVPTGNGPVAVVSATTQENYIYPANTVGLHASNAIDSRIAPITSGNVANAKLVFTIQNHGSDQDPTPPSYLRNTASWCYDLRQQMTCISPWNSYANILGAGTAITAQHIVAAEHTRFYPPLTIRFITANNQVVDRIIRGRALDVQNDLAVYTLDTPLPASITPCKLLPANYANYLGYLEHGRPPVMILDQEEKALVSEFYSLEYFMNSFDHFTRFFRPGLHRQRLAFWEELVGGDSSSPSFLILNNPVTLDDMLVLLSVTSGSGGDVSSGTFLTPKISMLNAMIAAADADAVNTAPFTPINTGLQVQTVDLSNFNTYTPPPPP